MSQNEKIESLTADLPDPEAARRFFNQMSERNPAETKKLLKNQGLLSDVLAIAAFSPLLAGTLLQNPSYISWLSRQRVETRIPSTEDLLESLARFSLTNSQIEPQILLARFRRRELLRIYLRDIRRLGTIAETTGEISNLADAILEYALRIASQELDNRYGIPLEIDEKGRARPARFCVVSLGKLGSKELNYSSDIDLMFLYSTEGSTSGQGAKGAVTNREYFIKLAEFVTKIVGQQTGEGAAFRVDLRLRPHGRVGALAISLPEAINYYQKSAQAWERQTLIRARASAGDVELFKTFFSRIESLVYSTVETTENALRNVRLSKEKINLEQINAKSFNVKLGRGGIREIEFIAQALQLAHGGRDVWLRASHTLISLTRLADRGLLTETEMTGLFDAYEFLRRLEHRLQMEHGLQTHAVPGNPEKKLLVARRMNFQDVEKFDFFLKRHTENVSRVFERIFGEPEDLFDEEIPVGGFDSPETTEAKENFHFSPVSVHTEHSRSNQLLKSISASLKKSKISLNKNKFAALEKFCKTSAYFCETLSANPNLIASLPLESDGFQQKNYSDILREAVSKTDDFRQQIANLRIEWRKLFLEIAAFDVFEKIDLLTSKQLQTELAEASLQAAISITEKEIRRRFRNHYQLPVTNYRLPFAVLGLGKLGGRGMDYGSDLDLVFIYDDEIPLENITLAEFYGRFCEILVTTISGFTREGNLYRVDLRLRPDGKNGATTIGKTAFLNYLETRSAIWEWLAYVKLRGVTGDPALEIEEAARKIVHRNALKIDLADLKNETLRVRERLEKEKTRGDKNLNIKYAAGGLLDVYFTMRFLQLRDNLQDDARNRSTQFMLKKLYENKSLSEENFNALSEGHEFLNRLDHNLRLTVGRSNTLPAADKAALQTISARMNLVSISDLFEKLSLHRLEIRSAYENILD
jgi:[glutamine synthetase] adenylyltransferase / [glutamine synthetase]-adenylyl-L-tyrosine phosphorylase